MRMLISSDLLDHLAKLLAMRAVQSISDLDAALDNGRPGISGGASATLCPYFYQKAILTAEGIPADTLSLIAENFILHYEKLLQITCNAGGFSNPISKAFFNFRFSSEFHRSFSETKKVFDIGWTEARTTRWGVIDFLAYGAIYYCENGTGESIECPETVLAAKSYLENLFKEVHSLVLGRS